MKVLLIWNNLPEEFRLYLIDDCPDWVLRCNGYVQLRDDIPEDIDSLIEKIYQYCHEFKTVTDYWPTEPLHGQWLKYEIDLAAKDVIILGDDVRVVHTGCYA